MSNAGEPVAQAPEGAVPVTAKDVIAQAVPERFEDVEYWLVKATTGLTETIRIRPEIGERAELMISPLDGSVLGIKFEFHGGEKNEVIGRQLFQGANIFQVNIALSKDPVYKHGEDPATLELKRRAKLREQQLEQNAAKLAQGLDELD